MQSIKIILDGNTESYKANKKEGAYARTLRKTEKAKR